MKNRTCIFLLLVSSVCVRAQDTIYMRNGVQVAALVQEVGVDEVKYKKFDNKEGPAYFVKKADIDRIKYQAGTVDVFSPYKVNDAKVEKKFDNSTQVENANACKYGEMDAQLFYRPDFTYYLAGGIPALCGIGFVGIIYGFLIDPRYPPLANVKHPEYLDNTFYRDCYKRKAKIKNGEAATIGCVGGTIVLIGLDLLVTSMWNSNGSYCGP